MSIDLSQFHQTFFDESREGIDAMEQALLTLDVGNADPETINTVFRSAHSIKGGAGTFGFESISSFTHHLEALLDELRNGHRSVDQELVDVLLSAIDCLRELLAAAQNGEEGASPARSEVEAQLRAILDDPGEGTAETATTTPTPAAAALRRRYGGRLEDIFSAQCGYVEKRQ